MRFVTRHYRKIRYWFIRAALLCAVIWIFLEPSIIDTDFTGDNVFTIKLNGEDVGMVSDEELADKCLRNARRRLQLEESELVLTNAKLAVYGSRSIWTEVDDERTVTDRMEEVLRRNYITTLHRGYTVKINGFSVSVASIDDVLTILNAALDKYDNDDEYEARLVLDSNREVNVLTTEVVTNRQAKEEEEINENPLQEAGISSYLTKALLATAPTQDEDTAFEEFDLGVQSLDFGDKVEIVESYLPEDGFTPLDAAIEEVTKDQEKNQIYEVQSGDTLGVIAEKYGLALDDLIAMNPTLDDASSIIRPQDELIVTVPQPELTVLHSDLEYYEEDYEAEVQYVDNDSWYTTKSVVLQEPSDGHHKVVVLNSYANDNKVSTETVKEEVTYEAVPKIVERGTIVPPSYIKPISGGRLSSGFGRRSRPTKGASTYHKGVDWATPVGTAVVASSGGTVARAGWGRGYGYVVYINHPDGRQTRYGHLSRILVSPGDTVTQGQKIALSGNTGVSTGAHLHFEILIGGTQVNPLSYIGN